MHRLREETLDLSRALHGELVFVAELVHTEDGDDVLQLAVLLEGLLHFTCDAVCSSPTTSASRIREVDSSGSTAG